MNIKKIELLNSEGPILRVIKRDFDFEIIDQHNVLIDILTKTEIQEFIHGDRVIVDSKDKKFIYSSFPGSMKPDLKKLDEFIGINTIGKIY